MSYQLQHTAEAIDYKLALIDKNKNFLEYPYTENLPNGFKDVGDGSILTYEPSGATETRFLLSTCSIPVCKKYTISLSITDVKEEVITNSNIFLEVIIDGETKTVDATENGYKELDLSAKAGNDVAAAVYLNVPIGFDSGLLIKPQIEEQNEENEHPEKPTAWTPYMKTVGAYVDQRFNGTNAKIAKIINDTADMVQTRTIKIGDKYFTEERLKNLIDLLDVIDFSSNE